ncbi:hypothetical protein PDJAM_G00069540 [Pangasius djambal]|uniref:Uncharacterized protein n=1 Tax=Pangasius djambal TaxID=1691987 RepID=A0ACC5YZX0_9TELE|nr:hypothetical protein [Pangasius djambal]
MVSGFIKSKVSPFSRSRAMGYEEMESGRRESTDKPLKPGMPAGLMFKHLKEREEKKKRAMRLIALCFGPRFSPDVKEFGDVCKIIQRERERERDLRINISRV